MDMKKLAIYVIMHKKVRIPKHIEWIERNKQNTLLVLCNYSEWRTNESTETIQWNHFVERGRR